MAPMVLKGMRFIRVSPDLWRNEESTIWVALVPSSPAYPWRFGINGHWFKSQYISPVIAYKRGLERIEFHGIELKPCQMAIAGISQPAELDDVAARVASKAGKI
jgi:hypothetical protein